MAKKAKKNGDEPKRPTSGVLTPIPEKDMKLMRVWGSVNPNKRLGDPPPDDPDEPDG